MFSKIMVDIVRLGLFSFDSNCEYSHIFYMPV